MGAQDVESGRALVVRRINEDHVVYAPWGKPGQRLVHEIAVGIDDREAASGVEVLEDEVQQKRGFARAGGADHVGVPDALILGERHRTVLPVMDVLAERQAFPRDCLRRGLCPVHGAVELRRLDRFRGQVRERDEFVGVEQHSYSPAAAQCEVLPMVLVRVSFVFQGDELVAERIPELREDARDPAGNLPGAGRRCASRSHPDHCGKKRLRDFQPGLRGQLGRVGEERLAIVAQNGPQHALRPGIPHGPEEHLEDAGFAFSQLFQRGDRRDERIGIECAGGAYEQHELVREAEVHDQGALRFAEAGAAGLAVAGRGSGKMRAD